MLRRSILLVCLVLGVAAAPAVAQKSGPGTQAVKAANDTIAGLLKQKVAAGSKEEKDLAAKVTTSVRSFLDIDQLGKRAMVDNWGKLSKAQQDEFLGLLRSLIEDNYVRGLRANLDYAVDYSGEYTEILDAVGGLSQIGDPITWVTASVAYKVTNSLTLSLEGRNLADAYYRATLGRDDIPAGFETWGRTVILGVTMTF